MDGLLKRLHVIGGSGAGTTTLGRALAARLGAIHVDADDLFWEPGEPPYTTIRPRELRVAGLEAACAGPEWVLSGSVVGWGDGLVPRIDRVVWLRTPQAVRLERLQAREHVRFGSAIEAGGSREAAHRDFVAWAARYDEGDETVRSHRLHEAWLARHALPYVVLDGTRPVADLVEAALARSPSSGG